jgi:GNAT superfamily N-acetyltransferase
MVHDHTCGCIETHNRVRHAALVTDAQDATLPSLEVLVSAADAGLHPWLTARIPTAARRAALAEELRFSLETAAQDLGYAERYAADAPDVGQPATAFLDRWLPLTTGGHVLAGPRWLGLDPDLPFVGVSGSDRVLRPADTDALREVARHHFAAFAPGFVLLRTADPLGTWPGTEPEMRHVVGPLGELRRRPLPPGLSGAPRPEVGHYAEYVASHAAQVARDPRHARHARVETEDDLNELAALGMLVDVLVDGRWAGLLAAEPATRWGARGATVVELLLDHPFRGRGLGRHLSGLLARALPLPDDHMLFGTIHVDNVAAYRAALASGRVDVGGEVVIPL